MSGTATRSACTRASQGNAGDFLRGFQRTDANGRASFTTVYPGWYQGRAVHIHFKIRTDPEARRRLRVHVAAVLRRRAQQGRLRDRGLRPEGPAGPAQRDRPDLQPERRRDAAERDPGGRRLQGDLPDRGAAQLRPSRGYPRERRLRGDSGARNTVPALPEPLVSLGRRRAPPSSGCWRPSSRWSSPGRRRAPARTRRPSPACPTPRLRLALGG